MEVCCSSNENTIDKICLFLPPGALDWNLIHTGGCYADTIGCFILVLDDSFSLYDVVVNIVTLGSVCPLGFGIYNECLHILPLEFWVSF